MTNDETPTIEVRYAGEGYHGTAVFTKSALSCPYCKASELYKKGRYGTLYYCAACKGVYNIGRVENEVERVKAKALAVKLFGNEEG